MPRSAVQGLPRKGPDADRFMLATAITLARLNRSQPCCLDARNQKEVSGAP
jgi:hypothetical protein